MVDIEQLQQIALSMGPVEQDIKWENHLCFTVGTKIFLLTSPDDYPVTACFKVSEDDFEQLCSRGEGFGQASHFAKRKWIAINDISLLSKKEWETFLTKSFQLVATTLTQKLKKELRLL